MTIKLSDGTPAFALSTETLMDLYRKPKKAKDRGRIEAVLRTRNINIKQYLFLQKLAGNKPFAIGNTAYFAEPGAPYIRKCEISKMYDKSAGHCDITFIDDLLPRGTRFAIALKRLYHSRFDAEQGLEEEMR